MAVSSIDPDRCIGCGGCVQSCPMDVFRLETRAREEGGRAPCDRTCPLSLGQREYHDLLRMGLEEEAARLLALRHPMPSVTGRICPHPCESRCHRAAVDQPVNIAGLEERLGDLILSLGPEAPGAAACRSTPEGGLDPACGVEVAVIGSGPAGLAAAYFLRLWEYRVTLFEEGEALGRLLRGHATAASLPLEVLEAQLEHYRRMGIELRSGVGRGRGRDPGTLLREGFHAVVDTVGAVEATAAGGRDQRVFRARDVTSGPSWVVRSLAAGRRAAGRVDRSLTGTATAVAAGASDRQAAAPPPGRVTPSTRREWRGEGSPPPLSPGTVTESYSEGASAAARAEAERCLTCGSLSTIAYLDDCQACRLCQHYCPTAAIEVAQGVMLGQLHSWDVVLLGE